MSDCDPRLGLTCRETAAHRLFHVCTDVGYRIATEQITSSLTLVLSSLVLAGEVEVLVNAPVVIT
jgi:hypothetical protein